MTARLFAVAGWIVALCGTLLLSFGSALVLGAILAGCCLLETEPEPSCCEPMGDSCPDAEAAAILFCQVIDYGPPPLNTPTICDDEVMPVGCVATPYVCRQAEQCQDEDDCGNGPRIYCCAGP